MKQLGALSYGGRFSLVQSPNCSGDLSCSCGLKYSRCAGIRLLEQAAQLELDGFTEEAWEVFNGALKCGV